MMPHPNPSRRWLLPSLALTVATWVGSPWSAPAADVIAGPTGEAFAIATLPDGNYRFCSDRPPEGVNRVSGACFRFRKQGSQITGDYYYPYQGSSLCLTGNSNGNTFTGQGLERLPQNASVPENYASDQFMDWGPEGYLQVRRGVVFDRQNTDRRAVRYRSALLNLNDFYQYNAGTVLPPTDCFTLPNNLMGASPDPDNLREIGTSQYYGKPVYLDEDSITYQGRNRYRYHTIIGVPQPLSVTEYQVDCDHPDRVQALRSRYYDSDGDLQEVEAINRSLPANRDTPTSTQRHQANQSICSADA